MPRDVIDYYENDKKEYKDYISNKLTKELLESFYGYYEHDFIKLCKLCGNIAIWIEAIKSVNRNDDIVNYFNDIFKKRIVLIIKINSQKPLTYTAQDVIYTLRSFVQHGGTANRSKLNILREFFLGYKFDVLASIDLHNFYVFSESEVAMHKFEEKFGILNNHTFFLRDIIVLRIFKEINIISTDKKFTPPKISWPHPDDPKLELNNKTIENLKKYFTNNTT